MVILLAIVFGHEAGHALTAQFLGLRWRVGVARIHGVPVAPAVYAPASRMVALGGPVGATIAAAALWRQDPLLVLTLWLIAGPLSLLPLPRLDGVHVWKARP